MEQPTLNTIILLFGIIFSDLVVLSFGLLGRAIVRAKGRPDWIGFALGFFLSLPLGFMLGYFFMVGKPSTALLIVGFVAPLLGLLAASLIPRAGEAQAYDEGVLPSRKIVFAGVLSAIAMLLGATRLGFIPVPNVSGDATIMHVPAIIGGVLEGPVVGGLVGLIFGIFSWLQATTPLFKDPLVSILPRLFIGITAYLAYASLRRLNEYAALVVAAIVGTLTNTVLVLGMAVLRNYLPLGAIPTILPQAAMELVIAVIITVAVVVAWKRIGTGIGRRYAEM